MTSELSRPDARNCVVEINIEKKTDKSHEFIAKQPRYFDNESAKFINNERNFYVFANNNNIDSVGALIAFDDYNKVLFLKKRSALEVFTYDSFFKLENEKAFFKVVASNLKTFHDKTKNLTNFGKLLDAYTPFVSIRRLINEFPRLQKHDYSDKPKFTNFYDLISDINYQLKIGEILNKWENECIIHGDFHFKNILHDNNGSVVEFIDFELTGIGDSNWDIACFIHSILVDNEFFRRTRTEVLNQYINIFLLQYPNADKAKIIQFVGIKAIWHCWITLFNEDLDIKIDLIKKLIDYSSGNFEFKFLFPRN